jgi:hypothetical protein
MRKYVLPAAILAIGAIVPALAAVGVGYTLFGTATYVSPGNASNRAVQLKSEGSTYGGIDYAIAAGQTFADFTTLSTDYKFEQGSCTGGSPRFQINVVDPNDNTEKNIFAYFGPDSGGAPCVTNGAWANTGDFLEVNRILDTTQLTGGTFYDPYASALAKYGSWTVTGIQVVEDSGWTGTAQVVDIDNTDVNGTTYDYEFASKDDCKNNGWATNFTFPPGPFKSQGQCVSYFAQQQH